MKVLVTGGAGYIGSHTSLELLNGGHDVVILDNLSNSSAEAVSRIEALSGKKTAFYQADVRDKETLRKIFQAHKIDWVIHFAGLKAVGESCAKPIEYYDNNLYGTLCLLEVMKEAGVKKLIFSSSATVYGTPETLPLTENSKTGGTTNPYGTSKYFQEIMLEDVYKSDPTWTVVLLRYFNPVGAHESGMIGEDPKGIPNNLTPFIAKVAIGELPEIGVFGNDYPTKDGTGVRAFKESVGSFFEYVTSKDKNYYQVLAERRARRLLGETVRWNFICVNKEYFPITLVSPAGEYRLDFSTALSVKDKNARIQIVLRDSAETVVIDGERIVRKHRGVYVLDNVPICLPGCTAMTLAIGRSSVDTAKFGLAGFDSEGRRKRTVFGTLRSGQIYDLSSFR